MTDQLSIRVTDDFRYQAYVLDGLRRRDIGDPFLKGREALRFVRNVNGGMPLVSPLRADGNGPAVTGSSPGRDGTGPLPASRKRERPALGRS